MELCPWSSVKEDHSSGSSRRRDASVDRAWTAGPMSVSPTGDAALTRGQGLCELLRRGDALRLRQRTPSGCLPEGSAEFLVLSGATVSELVTGFRRNGSVTGPRAAVDIFEATR